MRVRKERARVAYAIVESMPEEYGGLVNILDDPYEIWEAVTSHFSSTGPTDYSNVYASVFKNRWDESRNPALFVKELDADMVTFDNVIDTQLGYQFQSLILQHALPSSWEGSIRS